MSKHDDRKKLKYESPVLVSLGGMAKGSGVSATGYDNDGGECAGGTGRSGPYAETQCLPIGYSPAGYCDAGTCATEISAAYCSAGVTAADYCEAGDGPNQGALE